MICGGSHLGFPNNIEDETFAQGLCKDEQPESHKKPVLIHMLRKRNQFLFSDYKPAVLPL